MQLALISCIIPVFNGERYLAEAIHSILKQRYRAVEIIVVDDGSTDKTAAIAVRYGKTVRYIRQANGGQAAARNRGLDEAKGEYVAFLDADDLWHEEKLTRQIARFKARPELDYCVAHAQNFWVTDLHAEEQQFRDHRIAQPIPAYSSGTLLAGRNLFDRVGRFNDSLPHGDSIDWFLRAGDCGAISELMPDVLLYRRLHPENRSRVRASNSREQYLQLIKASLDRRRTPLQKPK